MVPGCLAKAHSSALETPCVIFSKHLETHAIGKLWRNLSDLQRKRQGNRCSEAERDTEAGRLPRTRGAGTGVWNQGLQRGRRLSVQSRPFLWCLLCPAAPERGRRVTSGKEPPEEAGVRAWRGAEGCTVQERFPDKRGPRHPPPRAAATPALTLQTSSCRDAARLRGTVAGRANGEQNRASRTGCLSQLGALPLAPGLLPLGKGLHLGACTPGGDPLSPPGSSSAGVFRPGSALPAQAHCRVFGPNTPSSLVQPLV